MGAPCLAGFARGGDFVPTAAVFPESPASRTKNAREIGHPPKTQDLDVFTDHRQTPPPRHPRRAACAYRSRAASWSAPILWAGLHTPQGGRAGIPPTRA